MANVVVNDTYLSNIGNAIRTKSGKTTKYKPGQMAEAILAIESSSAIPSDALIDGFPNNAYRFFNYSWNWFFETYGAQMQPQTIDAWMFYNNTFIQSIPFDIKIGVSPIHQAFYGCSNLTAIPEPVSLAALYDYTPTTYAFDMAEVFYGCIRLRTIPERIFGLTPEEGLPAYQQSGAVKKQIGARNNMFYNCYSLRELPRLDTAINIEETANKTLYSNLANNCYALNEIVNLPVADVAFTSNVFINTARNCYRIKNFTFEPGKTANWSNQRIDLTTYIGWYIDGTVFTNWNSGCSGAMNNLTSYTNYKDSPDSYALNVNYSRYNKESAIATINSLPNCSSGTGNIISFEGDSGSSTTGGAIKNLTEEQIAVAVSKGWTVSLK